MAVFNQPPYPNPVAFDHKLADEAIAALQTAVQKLREVSAQRVEHGQVALENWVGPHADQFQQHCDRLHRDSQGLMDDLLALIRTLQSSSDAARTLQRRRDQANLQWAQDQAHSGPGQPLPGPQPT